MNENDQGAEAIHLTDGGKQHIVGLKSLKVLLSKDDGMWFAQGLEIDYAAAGSSINETKGNFESGLKKTITEHLKLHGTIDKFLKPASQEAWDEYYNADISDLKQELTIINFHDLCDSPDIKTETGDLSDHCFPFKNIEFLEPLVAA